MRGVMYAAAVSALLASLFDAHAQSVGAPYEARDPVTCPDRTDPAEGAIPKETAARYVTCAHEYESDNVLYLVTDLVVQVGKGRPFMAASDAELKDIDYEQLVYPLRGSYRWYQCKPVSDYMENRGQNCRIENQPNAEGQCYKTVFGDWTCTMQDIYGETVGYGPPPP